MSINLVLFHTTRSATFAQQDISNGAWQKEEEEACKIEMVNESKEEVVVDHWERWTTANGIDEDSTNELHFWLNIVCGMIVLSVFYMGKTYLW